MKKRWPWFVGASILTGLASSLALRKQEPLPQIDLSKIYAGSYWFIDQKKRAQHRLDLSPTLKIKIDNRPIPSQLVELTEQRIVFRDEFGYHLIITKHEDSPFELYDEADDLIYYLEAIKNES